MIIIMLMIFCSATVGLIESLNRATGVRMFHVKHNIDYNVIDSIEICERLKEE